MPEIKRKDVIIILPTEYYDIRKWFFMIDSLRSMSAETAAGGALHQANPSLFQASPLPSTH
jgi:hypothetical protein